MSSRVGNLIESIKQSVRRAKTQWIDRSSVFEAFPNAGDMPLILRNAMAVRMKFANVPIHVWRDQLIAGSLYIPGEEIIISGALPDYATPEEKAAAALQGISTGTIIGHIVPSYPKLLKYGTAGIKADAESALNNATLAGAEPGKKAFFEAVIVVMEALELLADRYSRLCGELAEQETDSVRKGELSKMAADLAHSPRNPPRTFEQAVASIWLTHLAFQITGNHLAIGRFDQHVYSFLERDLEEGRIDLASAQELVTCFFLKFNERSSDNSITESRADFARAKAANEADWAQRSPFAHTTQRRNIRDEIDATNHWLQNVVIGGVKPSDGEDATNPVTYMCLEAFDVNRMTNPCLTLRLSAHTPAPLYKRACEVLVNGGGSPAFFNDEAIVPALVKWGIPVGDARDYTNDGCWETIIAGRNDFYFDRFNMLRCLEWTLNHGKSLMDKKAEAPDLGDPSDYTSYSELYAAFLRLLRYEVNGLMEKNNRQFGRLAAISPVPLLSALLEGPMENGADMTEAGAKYMTYGLIAEGASHVIDSLAAIKKVVYDDGEVSVASLVEALLDDFEGHDDVLQKMLAAPKYGRNEKSADAIGALLFKDFAAIVRELNREYDRMTFLPGAGTFSWYIAIGEGCGASADGRKSGEAVSSNMSPSAGAATNGVTGAILSHAALGMDNLPVGSPTDLRVSAVYVKGEDGLKRLEGLLRSFVELKCNMLTLTVADTAILREAQRNPEKHRDLRVRMGGWSAYFTMLSRDQQAYHIAKQDAM